MSGTAISDISSPIEDSVLLDPPTDGISSLSYLPYSNNDSTSSSLLASTSWDGSVRIHDTKSKKSVLSHLMDSGPLLSLATAAGENNNNFVFTGGLDGSIRMLDISSSSYQIIGQHESSNNNKIACSCLASLSSNAGAEKSPVLVASAGWHNYCHVWDARQSSKAVASVQLPGKAFDMDFDHTNNRLVVITAGRRISVIDIRKTGNTDSPIKADAVLNRESSHHKYQLRTVKFFPDGNGVAIGSIEGRVAVDFLDELNTKESTSSKKNYAFKCHRVGNTIYPVNAIDFHPRFGTFATGGCDGTVVVWDGLNKKKLTMLPKFPTSIAALAFNHDGSELAIASSYTFEEGEREHPRDEIYVRQMLDSECQPKTVGSK